ncbi:hypothetical protein GCM10010995_06020 [Cysteiniphilum litorale]|uniref:Uncharacterized protein n=1 Tax=Cysteiniphilum litorale TaxID=2056700 RepID=A0A8J2Z3K0_9GAMM|nr:hypothetical protein GCM10010995_06020 [Cysteiniphilum litorale]
MALSRINLNENKKLSIWFDIDAYKKHAETATTIINKAETNIVKLISSFLYCSFDIYKLLPSKNKNSFYSSVGLV